MNTEEAMEAMEKGWLVKLVEPSVLYEPFVDYVGTLQEKLDRDMFWWHAQKGSCSIVGQVKAEELTLASKGQG